MKEVVPSRGELVGAAVWLGKRGVPVDVPSRFLATRLGVRQGARPRALLVPQFAMLLAALAGSVGYQCLQYLPGVRGVEMTESKVVYFLVIGLQGGTWFALWRRDRQALALLGGRALDRPRPPWREVLGGWFVASAVVTFVGGAALGVTMFATTSYRTYAWSWLGVLALGAVMCAVITAGVLRRPVIAENEATLAVDAVLRAQDLHLALPSAYACPVLLDLVTTHRQPPGSAPWLVTYAALAVVLQLAGVLAVRRRLPALPDSDYGVPAEAAR